MKDIRDVQIDVGDTVVLMYQRIHQAALAVGTVTGFTPQSVRVDTKNGNITRQPNNLAVVEKAPPADPTPKKQEIEI